jgi:hypothetical protein
LQGDPHHSGTGLTAEHLPCRLTCQGQPSVGIDHGDDA